MTDTTPSSSSQWRIVLWLPAVLLLGIAGALLGFFLPSPTEQSTATNAAATVATRESDTRDGAASVNPPADRSPLPHAEFPLSPLDIRDTQEAPSLAVDSQGRVHLAFASKTSETERTLYFTSAEDAALQFAKPRAIGKSGIFKSGGGGAGKGGHERRMLPRLAVGGRSLHLAWCDAPADGSRVRMLLRESRDGGKSFTDPVSVHRSDTARPTFTSLAANGAGYIAASWLDSRNGPQQVFAAIRTPESSEFFEESLVFAGQDEKGVCPCCPTASLVLADGTLLVAYRSQVDGYRDIWICRREPGTASKFSAPIPVVTPTWKFDGCPHDGPALAVAGDWVHVAWMDAHTGRQRVYYGRAKLNEMQFETQELDAAGPGTQANVQLLVDDSGRLHAVWEGSLDDEIPQADTTTGAESNKGHGGGHSHAGPSGSGRVIMHACSPTANGRFEPARAIAPRPGHFQIRPAIAGSANGLLVAAWMELNESGKRVVVTKIDAPQGSAPERNSDVGGAGG